jgi:hypothetical protein
MYGIVGSFVPRICRQSIGADVEQIATLLAGIGGDCQLDEWWECPVALCIGNSVSSSWHDGEDREISASVRDYR